MLAHCSLSDTKQNPAGRDDLLIYGADTLAAGVRDPAIRLDIADDPAMVVAVFGAGTN